MPTALLKGKIALVTAAAGAGIGHATVRAFAEEGADVVVTDIHEGRTLSFCAELEKEFERPFPGFVVDVTKEDQVNHAVAETQKRYGRIDILVNNAARNIPKPVWEMPTDTWRFIVDICLTSQFFFIRAALPKMIERKSGCIINISSGAAWVPFKWGDSAYSAAKAGVLALTRAVAAEVGPHNIRVNAIAPDLIWNDHLAKIYPPEYFDDLKKMSVTGKTGRPEDMARIALFLATDTYLTGQVINGSGGIYMHP